jgi:DNA-binding beta-propeller fold protein YncE
VGHGGFHVPHGIAIDGRRGRVLVGDRQNDLVQVFDLEGGYIAEWSDVYRPAALTVSPDGLVFVAEMFRPAGGSSFRTGITPVDQPSRVSVFDDRGVLLARFTGPGKFNGIAVDSHGDLYVSNHQVQKFTPLVA